MDFVKEDLFKDQVYVFTPNGEVMELPTGSGPIDFAYHIHSEIGNKTIGAKVNGRIVALDYKLKNGDIVNILTNSNSNGPSRDWLKFTNTSKARNRIKRFFKLQDLEANSELGESILEKELKETGHSLKVLNNKKVEASLLERFNYNTLTDLFASIGLGEVSVSTIINFLDLKQEKAEEEVLDNDTTISKEASNRQRQRTVHESGVVVEGADNLMIRLSKCCNPVPGDEIIGYITRGRGISVHRKDCPNLLAETELNDRLIDVKWDQEFQPTEEYITELFIIGFDRAGLINDVLHVVSHTVKSLLSVNGKRDKNSTATVSLKVAVSNTMQLDDLINKLKNIPDVYEVKRVTG